MSKLPITFPTELWLHQILPFVLDLNAPLNSSFSNLCLVCKYWAGGLMNYSIISDDESIWPTLLTLTLDENETLKEVSKDETDWRRVFAIRSVPRHLKLELPGHLLLDSKHRTFSVMGKSSHSHSKTSTHQDFSPCGRESFILEKFQEITNQVESIPLERFSKEFRLCTPSDFVSSFISAHDFDFNVSIKEEVNNVFIEEVVDGLVGSQQGKPKNIGKLKDFLDDECTMIMHFNQCRSMLFYLLFVLFGKDDRGIVFVFDATD